ncbi:hypothetical protein [uncultured Faecalibaculum sp.]|uniref:hypothetical protein n=1 Tax=uncultured Faecalibaculum sp. TaxID=1729681 RepID=UPI0025D75925|nr:hypothetical protein [uncultured Faecalibaculum sp.]
MKQEVIKYIEKPWGYEKLFTCNDSYALKEIGFKKGARCSLQKHVQKLEHAYILYGEIQVEEDNENGEIEVHVYRPGECYEQKPGARHRVTALEDSAIIEVSTPHLDDVIRLEDDYGRQDR